MLLVGADYATAARTFFLASLAGALGILGLTGLLIADNYRYVIAAHAFLLPVATMASMVILGDVGSELALRIRRASTDTPPTVAG